MISIKAIAATVLVALSLAESGSVDEIATPAPTKNGFGGTATSLAEAEDQAKKVSATKELKKFNEEQKTDIDCNKLFKAYADTPKVKACQLMEVQHPSCKIRCDFNTNRKPGSAPTERAEASTGAVIPDAQDQGDSRQTGTTPNRSRGITTQTAKVPAARRSIKQAEEDDSDDSTEDDGSNASSDGEQASAKSKRPQDGSSSSGDDSAPNASKSAPSNSNNYGQSGPTDDQVDAALQAEAEALTDCKAQRDAAISACSYTDDTESASASAGLINTCDQMRDKGLKSSKAKSEAARTCIAKYNSCSTSCNSYADHYYDLDSAYTFHAVATMCQSLSSRADELNTASTTSISASDSGLNCMSNASDSSGAGGGGKGEDSAMKSTAAKQQAAVDACTTNPQSQECVQAQADQYMAARKAVGQFNELDTSKGSADVTDGSGLNVNPGGALGVAGAGGGDAKNGTIANNSGGGIPGGGGSASQSSTGAAGRPSGDARPGDALPNPVAVALGGYAAVLNGENPWGNQSLIGMDPARIKRVIASLDVDEKAIDLKRYLPGGDLAPPPPNPYDIQYHAKMVDIFERISIRYEVKCRLRLMVGCENGMPF